MMEFFFPLLSCLREKTYPKILLLLYIFLIYIFVVFTYFLFIYLLMLFFSLPGESTTAVELQPETVQGCEVWQSEECKVQGKPMWYLQTRVLRRERKQSADSSR